MPDKRRFKVTITHKDQLITAREIVAAEPEHAADKVWAEYEAAYGPLSSDAYYDTEVETTDAQATPRSQIRTSRACFRGGTKSAGRD